MKRIFTIISILFSAAAFSQQYNNEWIDFTKVYYKFKVGQTGLYRISQSTLNAAGLGSTPAEQFKLIRNGVEVAIYTSVATGQLGASDYIEFWGEMNDGKPDKVLYRDPAYQHSDVFSIQTDTAVYFLTTSIGSNLRIIEQANNVVANVQPAEDFFMYTAGNHFRSKINLGFAKNAGEYVYSSSYDKGEFWSSADIRPATPLTDQLTDLFVYTGGPNAYVKFGAFGNAPNIRSLNLKINGTTIKDTSFSDFTDVLFPQLSFSSSLINTSSATTVFTVSSAVSTDRVVISYYDIVYPRRFNFGAAKNFKFELPAKGSDYYLAITNFNRGAALPVLYDLTNRNRYTAVLGEGDTIKFVLPASSQQRNLILVNEETSNINAVAGLTTKTFTDYTNTANQGDYLIISNPILYTGTSGNNPVVDYKNYRASAAGGSYNVAIMDINELADQFAFGIKKHPLSIKNFLRYARTTYNVAPKFVLLIGKGVDYMNYRNNQSNPLADRVNLIPGFGYPGSDNMLSSESFISAIPVTPIGRLSVVNGKEIEDYLEKIKEYELAQKTAPNTLDGRLWMKNIMHITGASQSQLGITLCNYIHGFRDIISDTLTGTKVSILCKNSANPLELVSNEHITRLFEEGLSMVTYFGHSSSNTLEFNIDDPYNYHNPGKYPVFSVNGCNAGNFFAFSTNRLQNIETLSEKFVLAKQRGGIAFLASTHFGIVNYLNIYLNSLYNNLSDNNYGQSLGEIFKSSLFRLVNTAAPGDFFARIHSEEIAIHGDPALKMNFQEKPDYVVEDPQIKISPSFVSIAENEFNLKVKLFNLGKAIGDSITLEIKRQYPDGSSEIIYRQRITGILYSDSISIQVPVIGTRDKGSNKLTVRIDADDDVTEMDENNNIITKEVIIYEDEARPSFPYNYTIVSNTSQKLYASTANPLSELKQYVMEIDTTIAFNSPLKTVRTISSVGGTMEFTPGITFVDSTVYYWRVALVPSSSNDYHWNTSSFIYIAGTTLGFNQSHAYQHLGSEGDGIYFDDNSRKWKFSSNINNLYIQNGSWATSAFFASEVAVSINGNQVATNACAFSSLVFTIIDPITFKPWTNVTVNGQGKYGSWLNNCFNGRQTNFEFRYTDTASRRSIISFMDNVIPDGFYVIVRSFLLNPPSFPDYPQAFVSDWKADTAYFGLGNTVYDRLLQNGFTTIDSFYRPRNFIFVYKKNSTEFIPKYDFTNDVYDKITLTADCPTPDTLGYIISPKFGPALQWKQLHWNGESEEINSADNPSIEVIGVTPTNTEVVLFNLNKNTHDLDISSVNAEQYPYIKLRMRNIDSVALTPYQLKYWRLDYNPVPEGALAPNLFFTTKDTLDIGEKLNLGVAFKNVSPAAFDSMKVKLIVIDRDNASHVMSLPAKVKPLSSGDTVHFRYEIDTKDFPGNNTLSLDFNPDNDQPEQYHYNNFLYRDFYVKPDNINPLLDVTFDGVHILNNDIVSSKPRIQIKIKDEAKFMLLNDTSVIEELQVRYPDANNTIRTYRFDNDTLRFIPAQSGTDNTATIEFSPYFPTILSDPEDENSQPLNPEGDEYHLIIKAKDRSNNNAGQTEYKVSFKVIDKPMISNLLNYPNPFTTSTAFVFTITGSEVPQNMKIQILTVTGKIVKEITREELGPIHIGRNITEYKWNGTDQYGQRLANGVYLYRVVTMLNGKRMEKYKTEGDDTDRYFKGGYGKMYLMR